MLSHTNDTIKDCRFIFHVMLINKKNKLRKGKQVILWLLFNTILSAISWWEQVNFQWDDDEVRFVLDQHA